MKKMNDRINKSMGPKAILLCGISSIFIFNPIVFAAEDTAIEPDRAYNQGVDFYQKQDYNKSTEQFMQSINTEDDKLEQFSAYNLGSAFFNQALQAEKQNPQGANEIYKKALDFFKRAIEIDPDDLDAKYNYELTSKKIIEQEQKSQDQQNKQNNKDRQDQKKDQNSNDNNDSSQGQDKKDNQDEKDDQDKQQNKNNDQKDKDDDKQKDQDGKNRNDQQQQQSKDRQNGNSANQPKQMSKEEAQMLLENFQNSEQQKKKEKLKNAQQQTVPGVKGW